MGSYLEINNRETNSKIYSSILIDAIREVDSIVRAADGIKKKDKQCLVPEYYSEAIDKSLLGCGNWTINRKGMALIVIYLKNLCDNDAAIFNMAVEYNSYPLEKARDENRKAQMLEDYVYDMRKDLLWCYNYCVDILTSMVLSRTKRVDAVWR